MANFKARARAIDMLGRQQIAGIPSAISELFKNAHDAYADRVEVDYYRTDKLFVLRDDGLGMTREDFENRWLTIGTESKMAAKSGMAPPPQAPGKAARPVLGEKGIGRLAIAAIGPHVLIITRAKRGKVLHDTVVAYIHWRIFEMPGIDLDDIEIPIRSFSNGKLPDKAAVSEMVDAFAKNLKKLEYITLDQELAFHTDFEAMRVDAAEIDGYVSDMSLAGDGHGTHFIIAPANEILEADIDNDDLYRASSLEKALLGFTNKMTPNHPEPVIKTAFRDHKGIDDTIDIIDEREFFTPDEFRSTDHHFEGRFDEYGQFEGTVSVYREHPMAYKIEWSGAKGKKTQCGPFNINIAYIQGSKIQSSMPTDEYSRLFEKTNQLGGLYIYKNDIRILPYGDTDYDWLEVEKRRTLKASRYFFSYRRMFGAVTIDLANNYELTEKAGREGFRENKAYREFRDILKNMFIRLAEDFFREEGAHSHTFIERRSELERLELARRKRADQTSEKRRKLTADLDRFFEAYQQDEPSLEALKLTESLRRDLAKAAAQEDERSAAHLVLNLEAKARQQLRLLEDRYRVIRPKGVGLSKKLEQTFEDYHATYQNLHDSVFSKVRTIVEGEVTQAAQRARLELDRRVRVERALNDLAAQAKSMGRSERAETFNMLEKVEGEVREAVRESISQINVEVQEVLTNFNSIDFNELDEVSVVGVRDALETRIISIKDKKQDFLRTIRSQLEAINLSDDIGQLEQMEALEQRMLSLEERADMDLQLSQLGMAIEVINHEFDASIRSIRNDLRRLKGWADLNQNLGSVYQGLRTSFEHLDGYLNLFTPLNRRLHRQETKIVGAEISAYLKDLFQQRFERHHVELHTANAFSKRTVLGYPSSFYPVFVNLTDNAIYWLKEVKEPRIIMLDSEGESFLISNNGPSILESRREAIFEVGTSFKPGGRGLGLAISSEVLNKIGYSLTLDEIPRKGMSVTFRISPKNNS
jgi:signal transduction histidine kinase